VLDVTGLPWRELMDPDTPLAVALTRLGSEEPAARFANFVGGGSDVGR
jgi:hypothetical protein